jgi:hypothetical protein
MLQAEELLIEALLSAEHLGEEPRVGYASEFHRARSVGYRGWRYRVAFDPEQGRMMLTTEGANQVRPTARRI